MGKEWELKFRAERPEVLDDILRDFALPWEEIPMASTYFDTEQGDLTRRKWTLRLRREGETSVVTMKTAGDGKARGEWEYCAEDVSQAAELLCAQGAPEELAEILRKPVHPVCGARFTRRAVRLSLGETTAELALDSGILFRGDREIPLWEVELELKQGQEQDVTALAEDLCRRFPLTEEKDSKFVRAIRL